MKPALEGVKRRITLEVLESLHWNRHAIGDALGVNGATLYKMMKRLGLEDRSIAPMS